MRIIKAPEPHDYLEEGVSLFLAGSIENGKADDWQTKVENRLQQYDVTILNPRRDDWDDSQEQTANNPYLLEQVEWELDNLAGASYIFMYFDPATISPISLMELGAFAEGGNMMVCCPEGYFRKANVEIFCDRQLIRFDDTFDEALDNLEELFKQLRDNKEE